MSSIFVETSKSIGLTVLINQLALIPLAVSIKSIALRCGSTTIKIESNGCADLYDFCVEYSAHMIVTLCQPTPAAQQLFATKLIA